MNGSLKNRALVNGGHWLNGFSHWWMSHWWMVSLVNESSVDVAYAFRCLASFCGMDNFILSAVNHSSNWYGCDQVSVFKQHIFNFNIMLVPRGPQNWQPREQCILQLWVPVLSVQVIHHVEWFTGECLFERMFSCIYQMSRPKKQMFQIDSVNEQFDHCSRSQFMVNKSYSTKWILKVNQAFPILNPG